jgi:predicted nucleic acid-binding protein
MPTVISNTSPIQYLYQAEALSLLPQLFGEICVPEAVAAELQAGRQRNVPLPDPQVLPWLTVRPVQQPALLPLVTHLGSGEKEVLALGLELPGSLLLLDDRDARRHASALALNVSGTLGILLLAKERGKLDAVRPVLDRLEALRFRLHATTRKAVLRLAQESD